MTARIPRWFGLFIAIMTMVAGHVAAQGGSNPHGPSIGACATCHLPDAWKPVRIAGTFRHAENTFPLDGAHLTASCTSCHTSLDFTKASANCVSCHTDIHRGALGVNCERCHTTRSFVDQARLARLHEETRFPLRGAHATTPCESCHVPTAPGQPQFTNRPTACASCHRADYDRATTPPHASAGFPTNCTACHTEIAWRGARFDHNTTQFPLTGAHQATACSTCHADGVYKGKPTTCASCHQQDYAKTNAPPHAAASFATTCATCHTTASWQGAVFNHTATQFPLIGAHLTVACTSCHGDGVYRGKSKTCVSCHQTDYDKTASPSHKAAGYSTDCASCHTSTAWHGASFDHNTSQFPLTGAHGAVPCAMCHGDGVFRGKPTTCVSCHTPEYTRTTTPPHPAAGFATTCATCHTTTSWLTATFNHTAATTFPLTGGHLTATCVSCHADGVYKGKPTTCVSCHQPEYGRTTKPPHAAAGFATTCATCHTTASWLTATFDHTIGTAFPLTGAHVAVACASCHGDGVYKGKPTTCISCHQSDYTKTANPAHASAGYSTDCTSCHTTTTWQGASFNHNTATTFPLTGAHIAAACGACHADGVFKGKPTTCVSCHQTEYNATSTPPHVAAGFANTCATCHTTASWLTAAFNHTTATTFPLTGAHLAVACSACHSDGVYKGKPTTCESCHLTQYTNTTNPPHTAAGFVATACATCHTATSWLTAAFNHTTGTTFPLTGIHASTPCAACHGDRVYRGKATTCVSCHTPEYNATTNPNHRAAVFPTTCESCHTPSTWLGATFNHDASWFPIYSGAHNGRWTKCSDCHTSSTDFSVFTCTTCHTAAATNPKHTQVSGYTYQSARCYACHPTGRAG